MLLRDIAQEHGDFVRVKVGTISVYLVSNPDYLQYILRDNQPNFIKSPMLYNSAKMLVGNGLLTSDGEFWLRQRRMIQPQFHRQKIAAFVTEMIGAIDHILDAWAQEEQPQTIELKERMSQITMEVVSRTMFGSNVMSPQQMTEINKEMVFAADYVALRGYTPFLPKWFPLPGTKRFAKSMETLTQTVNAIIETGRGKTEVAGNLLSMLIHAIDEETNEQMTNEQLFDEIMTTFSAGFETTSTALAWLFYVLDKNPEIKARLLEEVDSVLGDRPPTFEDMRQLPYCRMTFQEALRYYPPIGMLPRTAIEDDVIGGHPIPAGTVVLVFYYGVHHNPQVWPEPERFDPERFADTPANKRHRFAYLPFSGGPRQCIGNEFAITEGVLALVMLLQRYRIDVLPGQEVNPKLSATFAPSKKIMATLQAR